MLEVSRDAAAVGEGQLASCAAEQSKYCSICTVTLGSCDDLPFTSWGRWQCLRGGAGGLNGSYAACGCGTDIGVGPCWGEACGDMLEATARIASRRNSTISLDPNLPGQKSREMFFRRRFKIVQRFKYIRKGDWAKNP
jgi:hypothetical protein